MDVHGKTTAGDPRRLSAWPVRILVYAVLIVLAVLAIRVIDGHAMSKQAETGSSEGGQR